MIDYDKYNITLGYACIITLEYIYQYLYIFRHVLGKQYNSIDSIARCFVVY